MARVEENLIRAAQMIDFLLEGGHNMTDVRKEFRVSRDTVLRALKLYISWGFGPELEQHRMLYKKAMEEVEKTNSRRKGKRG
ncbi:MAG: hypothetical protein IKF38_00065 [Clostridia bacterium]|nr:hypothetical protein [Clostridia bacterium]